MNEEAKSLLAKFLTEHDEITIKFANAINVTMFVYNTHPANSNNVMVDSMDLAIGSMMSDYFQNGGTHEKLARCLRAIGRMGETMNHIMSSESTVPAMYSNLPVDYGSAKLNELLNPRL